MAAGDHPEPCGDGGRRHGGDDSRFRQLDGPGRRRPLLLRGEQRHQRGGPAHRRVPLAGHRPHTERLRGPRAAAAYRRTPAARRRTRDRRPGPSHWQQRWAAPAVPQMVLGCALGAGRLLLSGIDGTAYCLDATTGKGLWHTTLGTQAGPDTGVDFLAPSAGDGFFGVPLLDGSSGAAVLDAADGKIRWVAKAPSDEGSWTTAAKGGTLYCQSATTLRAFRASGA
ncbi:outer membrane protein assembly factor BamB family protein [Kitasatospora sp. NPDC054939]